ncbi:MMS19, C-terminal [Lasallia pustulata]|uniref:MMS19 nucleotide excision repair protein n=1 Tax=Lasallia pustulata TaxID=136370 RepID=A0A1W5DC20_9LECA|nr:MMS19, C-terminal [Lasallia pustulata]
MSDARNYLLTVDSDKQAAVQIAHETATKLETKQVTLIDVVQSLGEYINEEDASIRSKAVNYLSTVIAALPPTFLTRQQIQVLCQFLCDRIEDGGAVRGLSKLQGLSRFNKEMATMTFRALLGHFQDLQLRPQPQRLQILELLYELMSHHRSALKDMGAESLVGITDLVSGEKDPRNLMIIFSVLKVVMVEWDIVGHAETLLDSVFCYFPITFRPPPDDPYGITAQDLKNRLRECIAATKYFAPHAFPQLLDKLDSTSPNVKKDVLQTITACALSYDVTTMANYSITLWESLKFEILHVQEEDLADEALVALRAIAVKLSQGLTSTDAKTPLARYLRPVTKECNEQLQEPQHKQAKPAGQILSSLGTASPIAFVLVVKTVVAPMLTLYQDAGDIAKQRAILEVFVQILDSGLATFGMSSSTDPFPEVANPLDAFKDRLFELFSQALMGTAKEELSFRMVALKGLLRLCTLRKYLQDNEIGLAVQWLDEIVLLDDSNGRDDLKNEAIRALVEISKIKPSLIMDITFPAFMAKLPDASPSGNKDYIITLEGLAQLSVEKAISDTLVRRLLNRLDAVLQHDGPLAYPQAVLSTLQYVLSRRDLANDGNLGSYHEKIVVGLIRRAALAAAGHGPKTALNDETTMRILGRLVNVVVRALDSHKQASVAAQIYTLFTNDDEFHPIPFSPESTVLAEDHRMTLILSTFLMAGVGREADLPYTTPSENTKTLVLLDELVRLALEETSTTIRQALLAQITLITNKFLASKDVHLSTDVLVRLSADIPVEDQKSEASIRIIFWIARGLILRLADTEKVLEHLLALLPNVRYGASAARGFGVLLAPDEVISKDNGCTIRLLAKQKAFHICVPHIARDFRNAESTAKTNYLIALSGIIKYIPTEVLMPQLDTLLPLLLQSLDLQDPEVKAATIETLTVVSQESPAAVEGHISSLVNRLLKAAAEPKTNIARVRHNALRCLRVFPGKVKDSALLPYKMAVTRGLIAVLDDPKRHVRKEAVDCRAAWFNMDEAEVDD